VGSEMCIRDSLEALSGSLADKDATAAAALDREAIAIARAVGEPETIAWAMVNSHWVPWVAGDLETQRRVLADAHAYAEASGAQRALGTAQQWLRLNAWQRGAFHEMAAYARREHEWAGTRGSAVQRAYAAAGLATAAQLRGDLGAALAFARQSVESAVDAGARTEIGVTHWFVADALAAAGDLAGARAALESSVDVLERGGQGFRAEARTRLARTLVTLGDLAEARRHAELARAEVGPDDSFTIATTQWALAAVAAAEGRSDDAGRLYEEARARVRRTGYRVVAMDIERDYAQFLIETGRSAEARPVLEAVRAFYDTPETPFERERTDALLQRCAAVKR